MLLTEAMADCGLSMDAGTRRRYQHREVARPARNAPRDQSLAAFVHEIQLIREEDAREADAPFRRGLKCGACDYHARL